MGLDSREQQAALAIDRAGLLMAARSYELKRQGRRGGRKLGLFYTLCRRVLDILR
jgi:hypothetical protein